MDNKTDRFQGEKVNKLTFKCDYFVGDKPCLKVPVCGFKREVPERCSCHKEPGMLDCY